VDGVKPWVVEDVMPPQQTAVPSSRVAQEIWYPIDKEITFFPLGILTSIGTEDEKGLP
jgi:hypothetical protein